VAIIVRRILIQVAIVIALLAAMSILWIFAGRQLSLWLDSFGTADVKTLRLSSVIYEGAVTGGAFRIGDMILPTSAPDNRPFPINIQSDAHGGFVLTKDAKAFPLGKPRDENASAGRQFVPDPGDELVLTTKKSVLSWPTPFDFNFMTGQSPSWKRHLYYRVRWKKPDGAKLQMIWRFEQYFDSSNGWTSGFMTHEGSTGLIKVDIEN
jgi:hypothetical protein